MEFIKEYQTLIAGLIAIGAAWWAYQGAIAQAKATLRSESDRHRQLVRATAGAYWAEIVNCMVVMQVDLEALQSRKHDQYLRSGTGLDVSIYDADPCGVGLLPSTDSYVVVALYKTMKSLDEVCNEVEQMDPLSDHIRERLIGMLRKNILMAQSVTELLRATAEIDETAAKALTVSLEGVKSEEAVIENR